MASTPTSNGERKRKAHSKSRNGCQQCKAKHSKCDEVHPTCGSCVRNGPSCSLSPISSASSLNHPLALDDLWLFYHWVKVGDNPDFMPFSDHVAVDKKQEDESFMALAFSRPYLLHITLALSALHLAHKSPTDANRYHQASAHYVAAINKARPHLNSEDQDHAKAVFRFSALVSLYALAEPPLRPGLHDPEYVLKELVESFRVGRGVRVVMEPNKDMLSTSGVLDQSRYTDNARMVETTLNQQYPQLDDLTRLCHEQFGTREEIMAWTAAIRELFISLGVLSSNITNHSSLRRVMTWHMDLDPLCLRTMDERYPLALIILAHYALLLHLRRHYWFCSRWPRVLISAVKTLLHPQWHSFILWPEESVQIPQPPD